MVHEGRHGFALVQGPPGTGKSTLLLSLLNVLHNAATQDHFERVLDASMRRATSATTATAATTAPAASASAYAWAEALGGDRLSAITRGLDRTAAAQGGQASVRKGKILVCAHSNAAVDELLGRMLSGR